MPKPFALRIAVAGLLSLLWLAHPVLAAPPACNTDPDCDDGNVCTGDACTGHVCVYTNNQSPCSDLNACTTGDVCSGGACVGAPVTCDDGNACTTDTCNPATGACVYTNNTAPCEDGNACTTGDACAFGFCHSGSAASCNDNNPCTTDSCDPAVGCVFTNNANPCSDGNACSMGDVCVGGACRPGTPVVCDDANVCTADVCNPLTGCVFANNTSVCDDGNPCTSGDACAFGTCRAGTSTNCTDNNSCTSDTCDPAGGGCVHTDNANACDDGNACTIGDVCSGGACLPGAPRVCADATVCTSDTCDPATGCIFTNNTSPCSDGSVCTTSDVCADGLCRPGRPIICDDANACTTDSCSPATGCVFTSNTNPCDDGDACTPDDQCVFGSCRPGTAVNCNDNNPCTSDGCDPATGVCNNTNNTAACSDGDACTVGDVCSGGACQAGAPRVCDDGNVCTTDSCASAAGCVFTNNTNPCDDGNTCTTGDTCAFGVCHSGVAMNCDDNNSCTNDSCDPATGSCVHGANTAACSDGTACTVGDACSGGVCVPGAPRVCDDNNLCTTDSCDAATGCVFASNTNACDDGNDCTIGDACAFGTCRPGANVAAIAFRIPADLVAAAGGTLAVPIEAQPAGGSSVDVTLTYDPSVLQATGAAVTQITSGATIAVDLATPGQARVTLSRSQPFSGGGPVAMVQFQVLGAAGTYSALSITQSAVDGGSVSSCGDNGSVALCGEVPAEVQGVTVSGKITTTIEWTADPASVSYDVTENFISRMRSDHSTVNAACLAHGGTDASAIDTYTTPVNDGFYYLVRSVTSCGRGTFGSGTYGESRASLNSISCP